MQIRKPDTSLCPFLVPVTADRLWQRPVEAYCRRPGRRLYVPSAASLATRCSAPRHLACPGYLAETAPGGREGEPSPAGEPRAS